jgi:hypothetical protein
VSRIKYEGECACNGCDLGHCIQRLGVASRSGNAVCYSSRRDRCWSRLGWRWTERLAQLSSFAGLAADGFGMIERLSERRLAGSELSGVSSIFCESVSERGKMAIDRVARADAWIPRPCRRGKEIRKSRSGDLRISFMTKLATAAEACPRNCPSLQRPLAGRRKVRSEQQKKMPYARKQCILSRWRRLDARLCRISKREQRRR